MRYQLPAALCSSLALVLSAAILVGWHTGSEALVTLNVGATATHYNTALATLCAGLGLLASLQQKRQLVGLLASLVSLIGAGHFLQYLTKGRWQIDYWFHALISDNTFVDTLNLAPTTAMALLIFGLALLWSARRQSTDVADTLRAASLSLLAITLVSSWAVYDQSEASFGWGNLARMAPSSLVVLALLAISGGAIAFSRPRQSSRNRLIPVLVNVLVPLVIGLSIALWAALAKTETRHIGETIRQESAMMLSGLRHSLTSQGYSLRRMANRLARSDYPDMVAWRQDAQMYLQDHPGMVAMALVSRSEQSPQWVTLEQTPPVFSADEIRRALRSASQSSQQLAISTPGQLRDGNSQFIMVSPARRGSEQTAVLAIFDGAALLRGVFPPQYLEMMHLSVALDGVRLFETTRESSVFRQYWSREDQTELLGKQWTLEVWPTRHYYADVRANLQDLVLITGLIIAGLLIVTAHLLLRTERSAEHLRRSENQLALLLSNAGEGIFGLDTEGRTTFVNRAAEKITGYPAAEMLNQQQHAIIHHSHADGSTYPAEECNIYRVLKEGGQHFERDEVFWRRDGSCYPVEYTSSAVVDDQGHITGAVVVFRDISELKEIENKLRATNEELENFAYLASHDLKAPLRVIHNASQWLEEDLAEHLQDEDRENLALLQSRVNRMERLLDDLLQYSRIGRVTDDRFREKISGKEMLDNILSLLEPPPEVEVEVSEGFADIFSPRMPLQQILYNLIANAIKHREDRKIRIKVGVKTVGEDYVFTVADNGPGIAAKYHQRIFDIFRTLKPRDQVEGSGIGLSIVKKYANLYGGRVEVHSTVGEGSCFTIVWPMSPTRQSPTPHSSMKTESP